MATYFEQAAQPDGFSPNTYTKMPVSRVLSDAVAMGHLGAYPMKSRLLKLAKPHRQHYRTNQAPTTDAADRFTDWNSTRPPSTSTRC